MRPKTDLRDSQNRAITVLYENDEQQAVLPMGAGKTVVALTAARELLDAGEIRHGLILAPKRVAQLVWPKEVREWEHLADTTVRLVTGTPAERAAALVTGDEFHAVGIDNAQWLVEQLESLPADDPMFDLLVIDEISRFKNPKSKRAKALLKIMGRFKLVWGLTGTPRPNGYEDQFKPLQLITRSKLWGKSFYKWRDKRFYPTDYQQRNWRIHPEWEKPTIDEINSVSVAFSEEDMPDLPELTSIWDYVDLPPAVRKQYDTMERKLFAGVDGRAIVAQTAAVASGKLEQIAQGFLYGDGNTDVEWLHAAKADWLAELVDSMNGTPLLVAYQFKEDLRALLDIYPGTPYFGAGITDRQAERNEAAWNAGDLPLLFLHPASAGHGLNLQFGGSHMAWYALTFSAELYDQTMKRFYRPGQTRRCFAHHCLARNTVDEVKRMRVAGKMSMQDAFRAYLKKV